MTNTTHRVRVGLFMLVALTSLLGLSQLINPAPASANHGEYVLLREHVGYSGAGIEFPMPPTDVENYDWYDFRDFGWNDRASSMIVYLRVSCADDTGVFFFEHTWLEGGVFGNGLWDTAVPNHWEVADLRAYGWNDMISSLRTHRKGTPLGCLI